MKTTQEKLEIMQAFLDGEKIEMFDDDLKEWRWITDPSWNWIEVDYRIKPEKQKQKRFLTPMELFDRGATHMKDGNGDIFEIQGFLFDKINIDNNSYFISTFAELSYHWTADRKTWNSFEVAEA